MPTIYCLITAYLINENPNILFIWGSLVQYTHLECYRVK